MREKENVKDRIFKAASVLVEGGEDADRLTTRRIAAKAGVNPALVNYYYRSKENLLSAVVGGLMQGIADSIVKDEGRAKDDESRLRSVLSATADAAFARRNVCRIAILAEIKRGCADSCALIRPLLRGILPAAGRTEIDVIALQLMLPLHHIFLEPELFGGLLKTDFYDKSKRDRMIRRMIGLALAGASNRVGGK